MEKKNRPDTLKISLTVSLGALAAALSYLHISFPFRLMPFLQYDAAEVPDLLALLLLGPTGGLSVTTIHWMILNLHSSFNPVIGPTMKFMAVFSTILGLWVGTLFLPSRPSPKRSLATILTAATAVRSLLMIPPTFLLYYLISPDKYLPFASRALAAFGLQVEGVLAGAILVTLVTAIFNVSQAIVSVSATWVVYRAAERVTLVQSRANWLRGQIGAISGSPQSA